MPGWIRERDTAQATHTPSASTRKIRPAAAKGDKGPGAVQSSLKRHFHPVLVGETSSPSKASRGKRKREASSNDSPEDSPEKGSQGSLINPLSLFGRPPQSSLTTPAPRTPHRKKKARLGPPAPAISPSKRKLLVAESAKDAAMQQHWTSERSSSPLQSIENVVRSAKRDSETVAGASNRAMITLTPSKLRHGYSMLAFDNDALYGLDENSVGGSSLDDGTDEEGEGSEPASPSAARMGRAGPPLGLPYVRSPRSSKRIYAQETQMPQVSPSERRGPEAETATLHESAVLDDSDDLSSPPPRLPSPRQGSSMPREEGAIQSSQTAPGGSFSLAQETARPDKCKRSSVLETYMSDEEDCEGEGKRRGHGDETYRLPSSEDMQTPSAPKERKQTLRSHSKTTVLQSSNNPDDDTQPLPWRSPTADREGDVQGQGRDSTRRHTASSWADVNKVWMQVDVTRPDTGRERNVQHQSSLARFGFERKKGAKRGRSSVELCSDVVFNSDDEVDSDCGDDTQPLPWADEHDDNGAQSSGESQPALSLLLPSEGDLDSQTRHFLDDL